MSAENSDDKRLEELKNKEKMGPCRDFLNGICDRGSSCKFHHPPTSKPKNEYKFCIDYQNCNCMRANCRFVHASVEDIDIYKRTGEISLDLARAIAIATQSDVVNGIPICKEFMKGGCTRNVSCRFWHINPHEDTPVEGKGRGAFPGARSFSAQSGRSSRMSLNRLSQPPAKRANRVIDNYDGYDVAPKRGNFGAFGPLPGSHSQFESPDPTLTQRVVELERRNTELSVEVESLKRELKREKERYEDLVLMFRESNAATVAAAAIQQQQVSQQQQASNSPVGWTSQNAHLVQGGGNNSMTHSLH